ncbi:MAG: M15 family metallopeptidase [Oscillospiraceae bacterium]|nr:M15 family metallopeptidase [Oscillospiraceae bacterium]
MSNGTRIYPEEREPRAIKIRQPKHTGRKILLCVLSAILIIAIGGGVFAFIEYGPDLGFSIISEKTKDESQPDEPVNEEPIQSSEPEIPEEPVSEPEPVVPEEPEENPVEEEPVEEEPVIEEPEIPRDEWYMILVNRANPLPADYTFNTKTIDDKGHSVDERIYNDLAEMIAAGTSEGLDFVFYTGYRTVDRQNELFALGNTDIPGGSSEHNCGLGIDIGNSSDGEFEGSPEHQWLIEHAHEYGFILRYPKGKEQITGFDYEPWHFRYVGKEQAKLIYESGLCLEEYLAQE